MLELVALVRIVDAVWSGALAVSTWRTIIVKHASRSGARRRWLFGVAADRGRPGLRRLGPLVALWSVSRYRAWLRCRSGRKGGGLS